MNERRKNSRFALPKNVEGYFQNQSLVNGSLKDSEKFVIKDIGFGGINIVSSFSPRVGHDYLIRIKRNNSNLELKVQVIYSSIAEFATEHDGVFEPGVVYSIGCKILELDELKRNYIKYLIQNKKNGNDITD